MDGTKWMLLRACLAFWGSCALCLVLGRWFILFFKRNKVIESHRDLMLGAKDIHKQSVPTMGGLLIIGATIVPVLFLCSLKNIYVILLLITMVWMGSVGFVDDYQKWKYANKSGISGFGKLFWQLVLGLVVGWVLCFHKDVVIRKYATSNVLSIDGQNQVSTLDYQDMKSTQTTFPFLKNNLLDYAKICLLLFQSEQYAWLLYVLMVVLVIMSLSNSYNLTDGLDGLASSIGLIVCLTLAIFAYLSCYDGHVQYFNLICIPHACDIMVFCCALAGSCLGFLWYNGYPAQVFMGDTGSLSIGAVIAVIAICLRKEWMLPILGGMYVIESASVILQVAYFKYTKKKYGSGRRIFKMTPIHHHLQKLGWHESKIVIRLTALALLLAILSLTILIF